MAQEAWRAYLELALGMTETSRKKATKAVKRLVGKGGATAEQLQMLAEDLVRTSATNREGLARMIRVELDRALARLGLASGEEVTALTERVRQLEEQLRAATAPTPATPTPVGVAEPAPAGAGPAVAEPVAPAPVRKVAKKVAKKAVKPAAGPVGAEVLPAEVATPAPAADVDAPAPATAVDAPPPDVAPAPAAPAAAPAVKKAPVAKAAKAAKAAKKAPAKRQAAAGEPAKPARARKAPARKATRGSGPSADDQAS